MESDYTLFIIFVIVASLFAVATLVTVFFLSIQVIALVIVKRRYDKIHDRELKRVEKELEDSGWKR